MAGASAFARRIGVGGWLAIVTLLFAAALWLFALTWRPSPGNYQFQGVDVSDVNGAVDWPAVKAAGADFAYIRATTGADGRDSLFEDNWRLARAAEVRVGALHAFSLCRLAADQANNFNTTVPKSDDALPPAVSIDFAPDCTSRPVRDVLLEELRRFVVMVEAHTQRPVILLVSRRFEAEYGVTKALDRPIWSAGNFFPPDYAARPWRMWRASDMRRIDGVSGPVNWDVVAK
ncbi:MAG: GH25 family lysozyme [Pseudomonadota bacterium]